MQEHSTEKVPQAAALFQATAHHLVVARQAAPVTAIVAHGEPVVHWLVALGRMTAPLPHLHLEAPNLYHTAASAELEAKRRSVGLAEAAVIDPVPQ